jgi:outer membrane protein assembly factor BamE
VYKKIIKILAVVAFCFIAGCGTIKPYEVDVEQGNQIDSAMVKQLHIGMTKDEVASIIGTPVLGDTFDDDYWSYVYTKQINGGKIEKRDLELEFSNDKLTKIITKI